jgi:hypothetical protein
MTKAQAAKGSVLVLAASAVCACMSLSVNSFTETGADFRRYRTYAFAPAATRSTGDPRLDDNRFFDERVRAAIDRTLPARGLQKVNGAKADALVHYHASVGQRIELNDSGRPDCAAVATAGTGRTVPVNCQPYVYDAGTLLIDLVDARTRKLLWRGWANGSMNGVMADQEWMERRVDDSVARILEKLPRRLDARTSS